MNRLDEKVINSLLTIFRITDIQDVRASIIGSIVFRTQDQYLNYTNIFLPPNCPYVDALQKIDYSSIGDGDLLQIMVSIRDILYVEFQVRGIQDPVKIQMGIDLEILYYLYLYSKSNKQAVENVNAVQFINKYFEDFYVLGNFKQFSKLDLDAQKKFKNTLTGYNNFYEKIISIKNDLEPVNPGQQIYFLSQIPTIYDLFQDNLSLPIYTEEPSPSPENTDDKKYIVYTIILAVLLFILLVLGIYVLFKKGVRLYYIFMFVLGVLVLTFVLLSKVSRPPQSGEKYDFIRPVNPNLEVFHVQKKSGPVDSGEAEQICKMFGAKVSTLEDLTYSQTSGADWCSPGWVKEADGTFGVYYPINFQTQQGCGNGKTGVIKTDSENNKSHINCSGIKPDPTEKEEYKDYVFYPFNCIRYRQLASPFIINK